MSNWEDAVDTFGIKVSCEALMPFTIRIGNSIAWFVVIFSINNTSDISKLLYVISWAVRRVEFEKILKHHEWYLCQISRSNHAIIVYTTTHKRFVIFTCRYFKLIDWGRVFFGTKAFSRTILSILLEHLMIKLQPKRIKLDVHVMLPCILII